MKCSWSMGVQGESEVSFLVQGSGEGIPLIGMQQRTCCKPLARIDLSRLQALGLPWGVRGGWEIPPQGGRGGDHEVVLPRTPCTKRYSLFPYFLF